MSEKPKIDPKLVITSNPIAVKQGTFSGQTKEKSSGTVTKVSSTKSNEKK